MIVGVMGFGVLVEIMWLVFCEMNEWWVVGGSVIGSFDERVIEMGEIVKMEKMGSLWKREIMGMNGENVIDE